MTKTNNQTSTTFCRLCANKIKAKDAPICMSTKSSGASRVGIIRQHYGIEIGLELPETFVCQKCWTTTDQFHQLYVTVQQNEQTLSQQAAGNTCKDVTQLTGGAIKSEDAKRTPQQRSFTNTFDSASLVECKVEIQEENISEDLFAEPLLTASSRSSSSSSSSSSREASPIPRKRSKPQQAKQKEKKTPPTANRPGKKKWSVDEIAEQNERIREYFQMYCDLCETSFEVLRDAIVHYRQEHDLPGYLKCCDKKFFSRTLLLDHIQHHRDPDSFHCAQCARSYRNQAALNLHMAGHDELNPKEHKCVVCGMEYVKLFQLTTHQRQKHCVGTEKTFGCDICGKFFFTKPEMSTHIKSSHFANHICDICAHPFKRRHELTSHYRRVHIGEVLPKVQCKICDAWLANKGCLRKHIERLHQQMNLECNVCGKLTNNQLALYNHKRFVHGARNFTCTLCDKTFKRPIGLREHMAAHTGVDLYTCTYCPRTFKSNSNMFTHRKKAHLLEWSRDHEQRVKNGQAV